MALPFTLRALYLAGGEFTHRTMKQSSCSTSISDLSGHGSTLVMAVFSSCFAYNTTTARLGLINVPKPERHCTTHSTPSLNPLRFPGQKSNYPNTQRDCRRSQPSQPTLSSHSPLTEHRIPTARVVSIRKDAQSKVKPITQLRSQQITSTTKRRLRLISERGPPPPQ